MDDYPSPPRCSQCGGYAHVCELPDSTCRLKRIAREFFGDWRKNIDQKGVDDALCDLAVLLRETEDDAWARLSEARTKQLHDLVEAVRLAGEAYAPCSQCGELFAELWHWSGGYGRPHGEIEDVLTEYCRACAEKAGVTSECQSAEPEDHIRAFVKVRHLVMPSPSSGPAPGDR